MKNIQDIKLVAIFDGWTVAPNGQLLINPNSPTDKWHPRNMPYDSSFSWIMSVGKIITEQFPDYDEIPELIAVLEAVQTFNIAKIYTAVVEFIKWYNENKEK
ncbi:MAG: hypothetical protein PF450_10240 [Bacteroidales bacterium]|jgi:hypothetical protein|nr:hypothetical protein [Bacteroidales bacterium]